MADPPQADGLTMTSSSSLTGTYALDIPGPELKLAAPRAVEKVNNALKVEKKAMAKRCESILELPLPPLI